MLTYCPNNLLLNSATLSTQSVTVAPINYILSFKGTGTITKSGTATGNLVGTGASTRVYEKFTPTAGSLTLTVSGTVTEAQLEAVTYQTVPRDYNATTSAAYYGPRFDYNPSTLAARGLRIEEARTNLCLRSEEFSTSPWTDYGTNTVTSDATTAPDGTSRADLLTGNASNGRNQTITGISGSTQYTLSIYTKLATVGTQFSFATPCFNGGSFLGNLVADASVSITSGEDVGNGWYRHKFTGTTPATTDNIQPRFVMANTGDNYYLWGAQLEEGPFASTYIPTAAASVTRAADSASMTGTNFSSWFNQTEGTFVVEFNPTTGSGSPRILGFNTALASSPMFLASSTQVQVFDGLTVRAIASGVSLGADNKAAIAYTDGISHSIVANGGTVGTSATDYNTGTPSILYIGYNSSSNWMNGWIKSITYYNTRLQDATIDTLTT
jgi:hypothetical protein